MTELVLAMPVSVEQIAIAIKQMSLTDQQRLIKLVPGLRQAALAPPVRTIAQARASAARLQNEIMTALDHQPLSPDEPFLDNLTFAQYLALSEENKTELWNRWEDIALIECEEQEVGANAVPAG